MSSVEMVRGRVPGCKGGGGGGSGGKGIVNAHNRMP